MLRLIGAGLLAGILPLLRRLRSVHKDCGLTKERVLELRERHFCNAQSVSYANTDPLWIVRGDGVYLYDEQGRKFLDTRNNVAHLGHTHPAVTQAVCAQIKMLNTNTRYLHENLVTLAQALTATLPGKLTKCFFVNSGSEANDLALRLARAHTGNKDVVVVDRGYHGHTCEVIHISPYKYEGHGGDGKEAWVHKVPCPDSYRAAAGSGCTREDPEAGRRFAESVATACEAAGGKVSAFFVESGMSVAGVILPPKGYLEHCYAHVKKAGGICVADEVQVGFGRFGSQYWGFEQQEVVPDIVTMGKPFGNGFPLAAVVTTEEVSDSFGKTGMEYFNTFGGNPVAAAAGLAVLEAVEQNQLQAHALEVGNHIISRLTTELMLRRDLIGDVRGSGLFIGIEFVRDRETKQPAAIETSWICSKLKDDFRILTSIDGPDNNVIVIKPPMCFGKDHADQFIDALDKVLDRLADVDLATVQHTPT
eukprot:TRINITY_DN61207_c0_g1_i1.p1 TRINITY_DN61207_c0_g1~~TRINITY_DN61207_c0_g1_i1.p1  ORF type:complete len:477 (+),score=114.89 TRINITY_DN61207_c0_g1_i1:186-1616(+)